MSEKTRASFLSLAIIMVLVVSAMRPTNVYADDGPTQPAPTATSVPEQPVTEGTSEPAAATEEATAEPVAVETGTPDAGSTEAAAPADASNGEAAPASSDVPIVASVPENTTVTVLDESGEAQPLASQETMDAIVTSDPIWCPGGQSPTPGANGCTESFTSFDGLLTFLSEHPEYQGAGTIYIQQGEYRGDDPGHVIDFNSPTYNLGNINNADLNVVGGWNTSTNTIDANTPSTFNGYSIQIGSDTNPWGGSLTVSNIDIRFPNRDHDMNGIELVATGDVNINNVSVTNAGNDGGVVDAGGNVNVNNSDFSGNRRSGLVIKAGGSVAVANSLFGNQQNARHQNFGLTINSGGSTSLFGVLANHNRESGADITAGGRVTIGNSVFSGTKHILVSNGEDIFLGYGLKVVTPDAIDMDNVTGNDNFLWGASLDAGGDIAISNSVFNENTTEDPGYIDDTGLFINGGGNVALNNVTASDNRLYGAQINADGTVSINNSVFNNNRGVITTGGVPSLHGHGLQINSLANIFINNTTATNNMLFGGELTAAGEVAIANSSFSNTTTDPDADEVTGKGLSITSGGNTSLASVILDDNQTVGVNIQAGGDVYLDLMTVTGNGTDGVSIQASCTHVFAGTFTGNGQYGLNLGNSALDMQSAPVFASNGAGDIFPEVPISCSTAPTPPVEAGVSISVDTALEAAPESASLGDISLNGYLMNTRAGQTATHGLFIGTYMYMDTVTGLQVIALEVNPQAVAMAPAQ